jgi:hypothetical protein
MEEMEERSESVYHRLQHHLAIKSAVSTASFHHPSPSLYPKYLRDGHCESSIAPAVVPPLPHEASDERNVELQLEKVLARSLGHFCRLDHSLANRKTEETRQRKRVFKKINIFNKSLEIEDVV